MNFDQLLSGEGMSAAEVASIRTFVRAFREAEEKRARRVQRLCPFGNCYVDIDPLDGKVFGGVGDPLCGCANLLGWRSQRYEGLPKPGWSGKARGRHGSRVQRSRHRRKSWKRMVAYFEAEGWRV